MSAIAATELARRLRVLITASPLRWSNVGDGNVPMREEDLEAALLLAGECRLIGPELPDQCRLVGIGRRGRRRVPEFQRDAIVPARIFGHVVRRSLDFHGEYSSAFDLLLEERIVILQEQLQELLLVSPLRLVVVLHRVRLIGRALWWRALRGGKAGQSDDGEEHQMRAHESSFSMENTKSPKAGPRSQALEAGKRPVGAT